MPATGTHTGMGHGGSGGHGTYWQGRGHGYRWGNYYYPYYYIPVTYTTPLYQNQATIDSLNAILKNCETLKNQDPNHFACDPTFIASVEKQLLIELQKATPITTSTYYTRPVTYLRY